MLSRRVPQAPLLEPKGPQGSCMQPLVAPVPPAALRAGIAAPAHCNPAEARDTEFIHTATHASQPQWHLTAPPYAVAPPLRRRLQKATAPPALARPHGPACKCMHPRAASHFFCIRQVPTTSARQQWDRCVCVLPQLATTPRTTPRQDSDGKAAALPSTNKHTLNSAFITTTTSNAAHHRQQHRCRLLPACPLILPPSLLRYTRQSMPNNRCASTAAARVCQARPWAPPADAGCHPPSPSTVCVDA